MIKGGLEQKHCLVSVADPDPFGPDPDPVFQFYTDPDPAFQFYTDPDPAFQFYTDPDPYRFKEVMYLKRYFLYIFTRFSL
jgi:hypothetical protein